MGLNKILPRLHVTLRHLYVIVVIMAGWVLFRAENLTQAITYLKIMAGFSAPAADNSYHFALYCDLLFMLTIVVGIIASMPIMKFVMDTLNSLFRIHCSKNSSCSRRLSYTGSLFFNVLIGLWDIAAYLYISILFLLSVLILSSGVYNPFIYFKF